MDREAKRAYMREWRKNNPTYYKDRYVEMKEDEEKYNHHRERIKKWSKDNPDKIKAYMKKDYAKKARRTYYYKNKLKKRNANNLPNTDNPGTVE